jgi:hypothetical protein
VQKESSFGVLHSVLMFDDMEERENVSVKVHEPCKFKVIRTCPAAE